MVGCNFPFSTFSWYRPAHLNGVLHWLVFGGKFPSDYKIVGFNFASEKFNMLPWPKSLKRRNIECLGVLGGCLCLFSQKCDLDCFEMWVMLEYGVRESWTKTTTISRCSQSLFQMLPVCYLRDTILLRIDETDLVSYDPVKRKFENLEVPLLEENFQIEVIVYEESLVSPGGCIGEETDIRMEENEGE